MEFFKRNMKKIGILTIAAVLFLTSVFAVAEGDTDLAQEVQSQAQQRAQQKIEQVAQQNITSQTTASAEIQGEAGISTRVQERIREGIYRSEQGKQIEVQERANNRFKLIAGNSGAITGLEISQERIGNATRLRTNLSNGRNAEIKIMPDVASEIALERLRMRVCSEENNCEIELKEVRHQGTTRAAYEMNAERNVRVLGLFRAKMNVQAQVDAETEEIIEARVPWWSAISVKSD